MAKVGVEVVGDSTSLTAALGTATRTLVQFGGEAEATAARVDASFTGMSDAALRLAVAQDKLAISTARYGAGSTGAAAASSLYRKQVEGIAAGQLAAAATIGRTLTTHVTAPTVLLGYEAVKMSSNFQAAMLQIQTQAGASASEVKDLSGQVLDLASSGAQQGPVELAKGLFHLESVGLRGVTAMAVLKEASMAAAVGMAPLEEVTTALGGAVVTGIKGTEDFAKAMGTLNAAVGAGNMHMEDLVGALGTGVLPAAKNAGLSLDQVLAAVAVMTDRGIQANAAGTRLRMTFALMQAPSPKAVGALADMGINATDMATTLRGPDGLLKVLEMLKKGMDSVGKTQGAADILKAFGGGRSGAGVLTLIQSLDSPISSFQGKLKQIRATGGDLAASEATQQRESQAKFHAAVSLMEADMIKLGGAITPTVTFIVGGVAKIAGAFGYLPTPIKRDIGIVVGVLAVGGPLILAILGVTKAVRSIGTAFEFMGTTAGPAIATVEGVVASCGVAAEGATAKVAVLGAELKGLGGAGALAGAEGAAGAGGAGRLGGAAGLARFLGPIGLALATAQVAQMFGHSRAGHAVDKVGNELTDALGLTHTKQVATVAQLRAAGFNKEADAVEASEKNPITTQQAKGLFATPAFLTPQTPTTGSGSGLMAPMPGIPGPTPLTPAQTLALGLAADPTNLKLLNEQKAADTAAVAALERRREEGKIDNAAYFKQVKALYADRASTEGQIASVTKKGLKTIVPMALQVQTALAGTTEDTGDDVKAAQAMKAWAEHLIASKHLKGQALVDVLGQISQANQVLNQFTVPFALQLKTAQAAVTATPTDDIAAARDMKGFLEKEIASKKLGHQAMLTALGQLAQVNQVLGGFTIPMKLQIAQARASSTARTGDDLAVAKEMKAFAQTALASGKLSAQGQIDAWNAITQANSTIGVTGVRTRRPSAEQLTAGLGLTPAQRVEEEARIAQAMAHGGRVPTGAGVQGIAVAGKGVTIHGDVVLPGVRDVHGFLDDIDKVGRHSAPQSSGMNAGRGRGGGL